MQNTTPTNTSHCGPNRWNPRNWNTAQKLTALSVIGVVAFGSWAAFRPEKLFVNETVSETFPTQLAGAQKTDLISMGGFSSLAHHTAGNASLFKTGDEYVLRLTNFETSNGPDVHVYLTEKAGTDNAAIKAGNFLDLGVIKGNIGDQNYKLPAGFDPDKYEGVSIWCKRFAVGFGGADLKADSGAKPMVSVAPAPVVAVSVAAVPVAMPAPNAAKSVVVTTGAFHQIAHATQGKATISEDGDGNRTLTLTSFKTGEGPALHLYLWKAENVKDNGAAKKLVTSKSFVDLGALKSTSGTQSYKVPKDIDLWQYLAVGVWCDKFDVNFGTAPLASPQ